MGVIHRNQTAIAEALARKLAVESAVRIARMNASIGAIRMRFITSLPGQDMIYKAKEDEARLYLSLDPAPETLADFPFIAAETGVLAPTAYEVAQIWLYMGYQWRGAAAMLEGLRTTTSNALKTATSVAAMDQIMEAFDAQIASIG